MSKVAVIGLLSVLAVSAQNDGPYYRPSVVVQLNVSSLDKSIAFYEQVLGFKTVERRDDLKFAHVETNVPGLQLGLGEGGTQKGTGAVVINFSVVDVVAARNAPRVARRGLHGADADHSGKGGARGVQGSGWESAAARWSAAQK